MATITGLRLEELSRLSLATTGAKIYTTSSAGNSYQMTFNDFYNNLYRLYLSGNLIPQTNYYDFVNRTDDQLVTGIKTFEQIVLSLGGSIGNANSNYIAFDSPAPGMYVSGAISPTLDWVSCFTKDRSNALSMNWSDRLLTGNWTAQSISIPNVLTSSSRELYDGNGELTFKWYDGKHTRTFGDGYVEGDFYATSVRANRIYYYSATLGGIDLENKYILNDSDLTVYDWENNITYASDENISVHLNNRILYNSSNSPSLYWNTNTLTGDWYAQTLSFNEYKLYSDNYDSEMQSNDFTLFNGGVVYNQPVFKHQGMLNHLKFYEEVSLTGNVKDSNNSYAFNIDTKTLTGIWTVQQLQGIKLITSGQAPASSSSPGISGQICVGNHYLYMHTGIGWGRVALTTF
jgi:hypothetical protein